MLRARLNNGIFILGIDSKNVELLKQGKPIIVCLAELGGSDDVLIMYGDSLDDIRKELKKATGQPLPEVTPIEVARNVQ